MDTIILTTMGAIVVVLVFHQIYTYFSMKKERARAPAAEEKIALLSVTMEQFKRLFQEAPVPYFILGQKGIVKDLNKAGLRFFGVTPDKIIGQDLFSNAVPEDAEYAAYISSSCERGVPVNAKELRMVAKDMEVRWVQISILVLDGRGGNTASLATIFDITEQKKLDQAKTEFVSLTSHQLRAPLATIKWYTEMLVHPDVGQLNQKQAEYIKVVHEVGLDMIELVDTLLNVSRMEIGKLTVEMAPTNVAEVTDSILTELSSQIIKRNMNIVKDYGGILTNIKSDPKLLRIVIHNLITNAIKYTPDGGNITISFRNDGGTNSVTVTDTGYGIPKAQQAKIFTKLFRADNVKEINSSQSTGLGLYLVKSLVEAMGGTISFQSEENKGTAFTVTL